MQRGAHSQDGGLACGGLSYEEFPPRHETTCLKFTAGNWTQTSHTITEGRDYHVSWSTSEGVFLMGGGINDEIDGIGSNMGTSSELVKEDGMVVGTFTLRHDTL